MEIKYRTNPLWSGVITFFLLVMVLLVLPNLISNPIYHVWTPLNFVGIFTILFVPVFVSLDVIFGIFVTVDESKICRTDYFFWKKCVSIENIETIIFPATFVVGSENRTLTIIANEVEGYKQITMSNPAFHKKTLVKIILDLKRHSPSIKLDEFAEALATSKM